MAFPIYLAHFFYNKYVCIIHFIVKKLLTLESNVYPRSELVFIASIYFIQKYTEKGYLRLEVQNSPETYWLWLRKCCVTHCFR